MSISRVYVCVRCVVDAQKGSENIEYQLQGVRSCGWMMMDENPQDIGKVRIINAILRMNSPQLR